MLRRLRRHRGGSVLVEFAIAAPMMVTLLIGVVETTELLRAKMKVNHAAGVLAKMIAQQSSAVTAGKTGTLGNLCTGAALVLRPLAPAGVAAAIASVTTNASGSSGGTTTARDWENDASCPATAAAFGSSGAAALATASGLVPAKGDSLVLVRVSYTYTAATSLVLGARYQLTQTVYVRPRTNATLRCSNC